MREHVNSAPADDELATGQARGPLGAAWRHHGEGNSISPPLSDRWSLTIRCVRLTLQALSPLQLRSLAARLRPRRCSTISTDPPDRPQTPPRGATLRAVVGQGLLSIATARWLYGKAIRFRAVEAGRGFESGRVQTKNKLSLGYGKITARIKMPSGQGLWPAFWLV